MMTTSFPWPDEVIVPVDYRPGVGGQEIHGKVDSFQAAPLDGEVTRHRGSGCQHHGVELAAQPAGREGLAADLGVADKGDALRLHQLNAAQDHLALIELHVGDAVHQQPSGQVLPLKNRDAVAGPVELGRRRKTGRPGPYHGHPFARLHPRQHRNDPSLVKPPLHNADLDVLDGNGRINDAEGAGAFTGGRTDAAGELGKIVGLVQPVKRLLPEVAVDQIVPLRDQVIDRTATGHAADKFPGMTERNAAIHAASPLGTQGVVVHLQVELVPVTDSLQRLPVGRHFALVFQKSGCFSHVVFLYRST
jgi:hypothetical protein